MAKSGGAIRAGRAFVELFTDNSKLVRGLRAAANKIKVFGAKVQDIGRKMAMLGTAAAAPLVYSTKVFAGFDDQMRTVQAVMGGTAEQFDMLTEKAKLLGRTTSFTAAQVASGMTELARAGFDSGEIDAAIAGVLDLARATGTELSDAANTAGNTLRIFNMESKDMGHVSDVLTAAANNSAQTLGDLSESMKYAGPIAADFGMSLEDTTKTLGALANFGIKGSMAGNSIKRMMLQLADPAIRKEIESMGVAVTENGSFRDMGSIISDLGKQMANLSDPDRLAKMKDLFGLRAVSSGLKLTKSNFEKLDNAIDNAGGTAAKTSAVMDGGIGGTMRKLMSAVEGITIAIGDSLSSELQKFGEKITEVSNRVTDWIKSHKDLVISIAKGIAIITASGVALLAFGAAIKIAGSVMLATVGIFNRVMAVLGLVKVAIAALASPIGIVIGGLLALGAYFAWSCGAGGKALKWLGEKFNSLKEDALSAFGGIRDALAAGNLALAAKILWLAVKLQWEKGQSAVIEKVEDFRMIITATFENAVSSVSKAALKLWYGLKKGWNSFTAWHAKKVESWATAFAKVWVNVQESIGAIDKDTADFQRSYLAANLEKEKQKIDDQKKIDESKIETDKNAAIAAAEDLHKKRISDIEKERKAREAAQEAELQLARKAFNESIAAAKAARKAKGGSDGPDVSDAPAAPSVPEAPKIPSTDVLQKVLVGSVSGTFNASAVSGLGNGYAQRTMKAAEASAKYNKKIARNTSDGGAKFA